MYLRRQHVLHTGQHDEVQYEVLQGGGILKITLCIFILRQPTIAYNAPEPTKRQPDLVRSEPGHEGILAELHVAIQETTSLYFLQGVPLLGQYDSSKRVIVTTI